MTREREYPADSPTPDVSLREKAERATPDVDALRNAMTRFSEAEAIVLAARDPNRYSDAQWDAAVREKKAAEKELRVLTDARDVILALLSRVERAEAAITAYVEAKSALDLSRVERDERIYTAYRALKATIAPLPRTSAESQSYIDGED